MNEITLNSGPIVVGVDDSPTAQIALSAAIDMAMMRDEKLVVVSAYEPIPPAELQRQRQIAPDDIVHRLQADTAVYDLLAAAERRARAARVPVESVAREGAAADAIVAIAAERQASLIVVGNRGMRGRRLLRTSVPNEVSHRAPCSVLIVDTVSAVAA
jgi:nucleotide-binding universal stress UspA family protein